MLVFCVPARMLVLLHIAFKNKLTILLNDLYEDRLAENVLTTNAFGHNTILKMSGNGTEKSLRSTKALGATATGLTNHQGALASRF